MSDTTELTITSGDAYSDPAAFAHLQRVAKPFAESQLVPQHLRGKVADVVIALLVAREMRESPIAVLQNIHVINGKAGWSASYMIARANRSGVFRGRITWDVKGAGKDLAVTARAVLADTGETVAYGVTMAMAEAEGWAKNPKYRTMGELMLRYRSATALIRLYCPEVMFGFRTSDELEDMAAAETRPATTPGRPTSLAAALLGDNAPVIDGETVATAEPEPVSSAASDFFAHAEE